MIIRIASLIAMMILSYFLGRSHSQTKVVTKQIEVIKHVEQQKSQIHSRPNASRDSLLSLMFTEKL